MCGCSVKVRILFFFFFNDTATTEIYTLSLHDALPISQTSPPGRRVLSALRGPSATRTRRAAKRAPSGPLVPLRQVRRRQRCLSSIAAAEQGGRLGTGCLAGRPVGVSDGRSRTVAG